MSRRRAVPASVPSGPWVPLAAGLSVVLATTALAGVIEGVRWLVFAIVTVAVVVGTGMALRAVRTPAPLVAIGQFVALLFFVTAVFAKSGIMMVIPGPKALTEIVNVLRQSMEQVQNGLPPVQATSPMLCLVCLAIGLVAVAVDTLAVTSAAPAASGLVLLCVFAVPASLADDLLPAWSFALGAGGFALLLVVDERQRHRVWRGRLGLPSSGAPSNSGGTATAIAAGAVVVALLAGAVLTGVGTAGRLPGTGGGGENATGIGVNAFTKLRGVLKRDSVAEFFRIRGLDQDKAVPYLRIMTLSTYKNGDGWSLDKTLQNGSTKNTLSEPVGTSLAALGSAGRKATVDIETVGYQDMWLPTYGIPRKLENISDAWSYDSSAGIVWAKNNQKAGRYKQEVFIPEPTPDMLRNAQADRSVLARTVGDRYYAHDVGAPVRDLARQLTANARTNYDKAMAIRKHLAETGGFSYSLSTAPGSGDPLEDFLTKGKRGYCEQFASSMAVMLRAVDVPARVAIGFTPGFFSNGYRTISSTDAHAWVEVYFDKLGWISFDPTPLSDGRGAPAAYETSPRTTQAVPTASSTAPGGPTSAAPVPQRPGRETNIDGATPAATDSDTTVPTGGWIASASLALLVVVALAMGLLAGRRRSAVLAAPLPSTTHSQPPPPRPGGPPPELWQATAAVLGAAAVLLPLWWLAPQLLWWLVLAALVAAGLLALPSWLRRFTRVRRLLTVAAGGPDAANAAWQELMAASQDRGAEIASTETVRVAARKLVREHDLNAAGQAGLRTVIAAVERSWYAAEQAPDPDLFPALGQVLECMRVQAPMPTKARLFPRSVLTLFRLPRRQRQLPQPNPAQ